jgi:hypothetical protein
MDRWEEYDHLDFEERCYEYDKAECYQNNNMEEQVDNESNQNPQRRKRKRKARKKPALGNKVQRNYINGRLNNVDMHNIQGATKVVGGYIQVDSVLVFALFDRSASHSFISADLVKTIERVKCPTRKPLLVQTPMGEIQADQVCSNINLVIKKENFTVNLIVLESLNIPLVLGNGWLCAHKAVIYATQWKIFLTAPSGKRIENQGGPLLPEEAYPCRDIMSSSCIS